MDDAGTGKMLPYKSVHSCPRPSRSTTLTTATKYMEPDSSYLVDETFNPVSIAGYGMEIEPAAHNRSQPACHLAKGLMHPLSQFLLDRLKFRSHAFGNTVAMDVEPANLRRLPTAMG